MAARAISAGEVVFSVPPSHFITSHVTAADEMPFDVKKVTGRAREAGRGDAGQGENDSLHGDVADLDETT